MSEQVPTDSSGVQSLQCLQAEASYPHGLLQQLSDVQSLFFFSDLWGPFWLGHYCLRTRKLNSRMLDVDWFNDNPAETMVEAISQ